MLDQRLVARVGQMCSPDRKQASAPSETAGQIRCFGLGCWAVRTQSLRLLPLLMAVRMLNSVLDLTVDRRQSLHHPWQKPDQNRAARVFQMSMPGQRWIEEPMTDRMRASQMQNLVGPWKKAARNLWLLARMERQMEFAVAPIAHLSPCFPCRGDWDADLCRR